MGELREIGAALEADLAKENLKEMLAEQTDKLVENITGQVPGLAIVHKIAKAYRSVKDYFLMDKILRFLTDISSMDTQQRKKLVDKVDEDPIYEQKFGTFIITAIDRLDFLDKATYLANISKVYARDEISKSNYVRFKGFIEKIELEDLKKCIYYFEDDHPYYNFPENYSEPSLFLFQALGILKITNSEKEYKQHYRNRAMGIPNNANPSVQGPKLTELGELFIASIHNGPLTQWQIQAKKYSS